MAAVRLETCSRVDGFQVGAHGALRDAETAGDLGVSVPGGDQMQQVPVPGGELGDGVTATFGVQVGMVQVGAQQREQRAVALGEVRAGPTEKEQPHGLTRPRHPAGRCGQGRRDRR